MNSLSSNFLSVNLTAVGSADDALDMQQTIQFIVTDKIRNSILVRIDNTKNIGQRLLETNGFLTRLRDANPGNYQTITLDKFIAAKNNESDLLKLLQSDGPKLGNSLANSKSFLNELKQLNLNIQTTIRYPVLKTTLDKDNKVIKTEFSFMNQSERDSLENLKHSLVKDENIIFEDISEGDNPITTRYESFDSFANLVPSLSDINSSISTLNTKRSSLQSQYTKELEVLSTSAKKIQEKLLNSQLFSKEDESRSRKMLEDRKSELNNALNTFELLKKLKETNVDVNIKQSSLLVNIEKNNNSNENNAAINIIEILNKNSKYENNLTSKTLDNKNSDNNFLNKTTTSTSLENSTFNNNELSANIDNSSVILSDYNSSLKNINFNNNEIGDAIDMEDSISNIPDLKTASVQANENFISNVKEKNVNTKLSINEAVNTNNSRNLELTAFTKVDSNDLANDFEDKTDTKNMILNADYEKSSNNVIDRESNYKK